MDNETQNEIERLEKRGAKRLTLSGIDQLLEPLGFRIDRRTLHTSRARWMTGENAGKSYLCTTCGIIDTETGKSAFHQNGRRDKRFEELQRLRFSGEIFAVYRNSVFEI